MAANNNNNIQEPGPPAKQQVGSIFANNVTINFVLNDQRNNDKFEAELTQLRKEKAELQDEVKHLKAAIKGILTIGKEALW
ncbi:hypothetical protein CF326_g3788 [Tilletia indica]|nr:hypothetical protein CF326_g3788 [Tilletia indica]